MSPMKSISPLIDRRKPGWMLCVVPSPKVTDCVVDDVLNEKMALALKLRPRSWPKLPPTLRLA